MLPTSGSGLIVQGSSGSTPLHRQQELALVGWFISNSYAMAISALPSPSMSAVALLMIPGVPSRAVTNRFFQVGFLVPGAGCRPGR